MVNQGILCFKKIYFDTPILFTGICEQYRYSIIVLKKSKGKKKGTNHEGIFGN